MARTRFPKDLTVISPCNADWNSMVGNDQVRFCEHCNLKVHNLSQMTRIQAQRLVARSNGRLCVRYYRDPDGDIITRQMPRKLHSISRRASRIAASAFSATLSFSTAVAQGATAPRSSSTYSADDQRAGRGALASSVVGTITDANGAVIAGATIAISNEQTRLALYTSTDDTGMFRFDGLPSGLYNVRIEAPGFEALDGGSVFLQATGETRVDRTLSVATIKAEVEIGSGSGPETREFVTMGVVAYVSPSDPFIKAVQEDNLQAVEALIADSDVNLRDKVSHTTALEHATRNANREILQLLLAKGANVNAQNSNGQTVLMMIDEDAISDLVWDLINAGAKVDLKDHAGNTALHIAASYNNVESLKTLLDVGAKINIKNKEGETALMLAASSGYIHNVRALLLAGADLNERDNDGKNALDYAIENDHSAVIRFLRSRGAVETELQPEEEK